MESLNQLALKVLIAETAGFATPGVAFVFYKVVEPIQPPVEVLIDRINERVTMDELLHDSLPELSNFVLENACKIRPITWKIDVGIAPSKKSIFVEAVMVQRPGFIPESALC